MVRRASPGERQSYFSSRRVTRRVPPSSVGISLQDQVLCGFAQSNHWVGSNAFTLNAVVSLTLVDIGTQSPTRMSWNCGRTLLALGRAALSNRS
jgi:hypothetical protein